MREKILALCEFDPRQKQNSRTPLWLWTESAAGLMDEGMKMGARVEGGLQQVC